MRATVREGQAEAYAQWEADTATERRTAELARAELERRAGGEQDARAQAEAGAAKAEAPDLPGPADTTPEPVEPYVGGDYGSGIEGPDAAAEVLVASVNDVEPPEPDATSPIEDPELAAVAEDLDTRSQAREAAAEARQHRVAEAQADQAQRAAMSEAAAQGAEMHSPEAWVSGPRTPSWGGPEASAAEAEGAEVGGPEASL